MEFFYLFINLLHVGLEASHLGFDMNFQQTKSLFNLGEFFSSGPPCQPRGSSHATPTTSALVGDNVTAFSFELGLNDHKLCEGFEMIYAYTMIGYTQSDHCGSFAVPPHCMVAGTS